MKKYIPLLIAIFLVAIPTFAVTVFNSNQVGNTPVSGYYLKTDGSHSTWTAIPSSSGSVSTSTADVSGYIPFWTTNSATPALLGDDQNFFWDNTNKRLGIGTTSPFASLSVNNISGTAGFVVGSSTKTSFVVDKNGNVGIGTNTPTATLQIAGGTANQFVLDVGNSASTALTSGDIRGVNSIVINTPTASAATGVTGIFTNSEQAGSVPNTGSANGVQGNASYSGTSTLSNIRGLIFNAVASGSGGTATNAYGAQLTTQATFGNITNAYGLHVGTTLITGNITTRYGLYVANPAKFSSGTVTTNYGLYLENQSAGSTNYAIYSLGGKSYFAGNVGIATTTPDSTLDVNGFVRFEGNSSVQTASIGGGALIAGACTSSNTTISSLGAYASTTTFITTPQTDPGDSFWWSTIALNSTTIKTRVCASVNATPTASIYNIKIIK